MDEAQQYDKYIEIKNRLKFPGRNELAREKYFEVKLVRHESTMGSSNVKNSTIYFDFGVCLHDGLRFFEHVVQHGGVGIHG